MGTIVEFRRRRGSGQLQATDFHLSVDLGEATMQDLLWIGILIGLTALTLAYIRLCDRA